MDLNGSSSINIISFTKSLNKEWHNNDEFLTWEYGKHHLTQLDMDQLHCCTFALGGDCEYSHKEISCVKCLTCLSFFNRKVFPFLRMSIQSYHMRSHTIIQIVYVPMCSFML